MNTNKTITTTKQAIEDELRRLEWMIPDAQKRVADLAKEMLLRSERAVKDCEAMMANKPCSMMWIDFADNDIRNAREARTNLNGLYEKRNLLRYLLEQDQV
jgi:hypothetical protein